MFKFASIANLAISMQICTFTHKVIYFNQSAISYIGRPCLQNIYPACVLCAAPASADAQFVYAASLLITSAIQLTAPLYNFCKLLWRCTINYRFYGILSNTKQAILLTTTILPSQNIVWPIHRQVVVLQPLYIKYSGCVQFFSNIAIYNMFHTTSKYNWQ